MTVNDMFQKTKAWMFDKMSANTNREYIIEICNKVLVETFEENNMCRMFNGKEPFKDGVAKHQVSNLSDVLDYEDEYLLDVIPKGIDANLLMDEDLAKMSLYQTEYNNARVYHQKMLSQEVLNKYKEL